MRIQPWTIGWVWLKSYSHIEMSIKRVIVKSVITIISAVSAVFMIITILYYFHAVFAKKLCRNNYFKGKDMFFWLDNYNHTIM